MRHFPVLLILLATASAAQPVLTLTGPTSVAQGQSATLTMSVSGTTGQSLAGIQWTVAPPAGFSWGAPTISTTASTAGKGILCNAAVGLCLAIGDNLAMPPVLSNNPFTDGAVASIPANFTSVPLGTLTLPLTGLFGSTTTATSITVSSGPVFTIAILPSHCDYNADGKVDFNDVGSLWNVLVNQTSCSAAFTAGCSLKSLEGVLIAALGGICPL